MSAARKLLVLLGCAAGVLVNGYLKRPALPYIVDGDNDFRGFYASAQLDARDLYNPDAIERAEARLGQSQRFLPVVRLPFYIALISPLRHVGYRTAYWLWQLASLAAVLGFVWLWPGTPKWITALACCWSAPLLECFIMGRDVGVILVVAAASLALLLRGRRFAAGCLMSLCLIKYNLFFPLPIFIAGRRQWRFGAGVLAGGMALLVLSFAVAGWSWPAQYLAELRMPTTTPNYSGIPNLHGWLGRSHNAWIEAVATGLVLATVWLVVRRGDDLRAFAAMLAGGLLVSYHAFFGDAAMLIPVCLCLLAARSGLGAVAGIALLWPVAYLPFSMPNPPIPPSITLLVPLAVMLVESFLPRQRQAGAEEGGQPLGLLAGGAAHPGGRSFDERLDRHLHAAAPDLAPPGSFDHAVHQQDR